MERPIDGHYRRSFMDWLGCAVAGSATEAATATRAAASDLCGQVTALGTAGHVLDFDDTYFPGRAHLSAPVAPVALLLGAAHERSVSQVLAAYRAGFEAMAAVAAASGPELYERGWHPTSVCGVVGAAIAAARILGLDPERTRAAVAIALLGAGGLQAVFGSDGKALQVGLAASGGARAGELAANGLDVPLAVLSSRGGPVERAYGMAVNALHRDAPAVDENRIKPWPCCLQTHGAIDAASQVRLSDLGRGARLTVHVRPFARQAASYDDVETGLEAKFSIPYVTAYTLLHGPPSVEAFDHVDAQARELAAARIEVAVDYELHESGTALFADGVELARVEFPLGSPERPMTDEDLAAKFERLVGVGSDDVLRSLDEPAAALLERAGVAGHDPPAAALGP